MLASWKITIIIDFVIPSCIKSELHPCGSPNLHYLQQSISSNLCKWPLLTFHHSFKAQLYLTVSLLESFQLVWGCSSLQLVETLTQFYGKSNVGSLKKLLRTNHSRLRGAQTQEVAVQYNHLLNRSPLRPADHNRCSFADDFAQKGGSMQKTKSTLCKFKNSCCF